MTDNIYTLDTSTTQPIDKSQVLDAAKDHLGDDTMLVLGWDKDGEPYFSSNKSNTSDAILLCEMAKKFILENSF